MATPNIVPRADQEGGLGTAAKSWGKLFIENAAAGGTAAATISNLDVDQIALDVNASNTTANVIDINAQALTTGKAIHIDCNALESGGYALFVDVDDAQTTTNVKSLSQINYDKSGVTGSGHGHYVNAHAVVMTDAATNHTSGYVQHKAYNSLMSVASGDGNISQISFKSDITGGDDTYYAYAGNTSYRGNVGFFSDSSGSDFIAVSPLDHGDYFQIATTTNGATTLTTVDDDGDDAHMTLIPDGDLIITPKTGTCIWYDVDNSSDHMTLQVGTNGDATFTTVDAAGTAAHFEIEADGNITLDAAGTTTIESAGLIKLDGEAGVEIENGAAAVALTIDNNTVDQSALYIDAQNTTKEIIDINGTALTTGFGLEMTLNSLTGGGGAVNIDVNDSITDASSFKRLHLVDYTKTGNTLNSVTNNVIGHSISLTDSGTSNHAGSTHIRTSYASNVNFVNTTGTHTIDGFSSDINLSSGGMASIHPGGIQSFFSKITDGEGVDFKAVSSADTGDQFTIETTTHGATTLKTIDDDAAAAHIVLEADGNVDVNGLTITLDAATKIELEQNTDVTGDLGVSAEATVNSLICTTGAGFGGGYGSTGATISTAGVGQFNGALTTDAALTADNIVCTNAATFGGGTGSTGVTISTTGGITADTHIKSTAGYIAGLNYRHLWIDAGEMVPQVTNGAAAGTDESSSNDVMNDYFAFDASTIEYVQAKMVMPEQWDGGVIKVKFYWKPVSSTTTSHTCRWSVAGTAHADGGTIDSSWGTDVTVDDNVLGTAAGRVHISDATADITIAGSPGAGAAELVYLRINRVANHVLDDLNEDAHLLGVAVQYRETSAGINSW